MITENNLKVVKNICRRISASSGVSVEDLYSECVSKLPRVIKNYDPRLGKPFDAYLAISVRGYALNFCRDGSFLSTVKRSHLYLYTKSKKFKNLGQAANSLMVPLDLLQSIHHQIKNSRSYNSIDVDNEWQLPINTGQENTSSAREIFTDLVSEPEYNLLEDFYINDLSNEEMVESYGQSYENDLEYLRKKLEGHKELFMDLLA